MIDAYIVVCCELDKEGLVLPSLFKSVGINDDSTETSINITNILSQSWDTEKKLGSLVRF